MRNRFEGWKSHRSAGRLRSLAVVLAFSLPGLVPALAGAVEIDRITVEDPGTGAVKFKVTSDGNVTAASYAGDGAGLANVPHWKGTWNGATAYNKDDCVFYGGGSWIALQQSTNAQPDQTPASWAILAQQGPQGPAGAQGDQGGQGAQGPQGPQGPAGSPDTQSQIFGKIAAQADGAVLAVQQGATEAGSAVKLSVKNASGTNTFVVTGNGQVGVGAANPTSKFHLSTTETTQNAKGAEISYTTTATSGSSNIGAYFDTITGPATNSTASVFSLYGMARTATGSTVNHNALYGLRFVAQHNGTGTLTKAAGVNAYPYNGSTGTITYAYGLYTFPWMASGTISNWYGIFIDSKSLGTGTIANMYGVYVKEPDAKNYFAGNVGVGTTVPAQKLEVNGGIRINTTSAKPACGSTTRGTFWFTQGSTGTKDAVEVCAKDSADAYAWRVLW